MTTKAKKVETKEEAKVEAKAEAKEKLVSLEMTEQESQEFQEFKLKKEAEEKAAKDREFENELYVMRLQFKHSFNGTIYGPGRAEVPQKYVGKITVTEQKKNRRDMMLFSQRKNFFQVSMSGQHAKRVSRLPASIGG